MKDDSCELLCFDPGRGEALRRALPDSAEMHVASERAKALGDPTRLQVAAALLEAGEACVCDLAWITGRAQNLVSHHLRVLRTSGVAVSRRDGKLVLYSLAPAGKKLVKAVLGTKVPVS